MHALVTTPAALGNRRAVDAVDRRLRASVYCLAAAAMALAAGGCSRAPSANRAGQRRPAAAEAALKDELIHSVANNLNHLEEYDLSQILPLLRDRLNQWVQEQKPATNWKPDPLGATLPDNLRNLRVVQMLGVEEYQIPDMAALQEAVWLRDIARRARGSQLDDSS